MSCIEVMPKLGMTMKEGTLVNWHRNEGETVKEGEILFEVETDKLTNEIEAKEDGVLRKVLVNEGETVKCLTPVAIIAGKDEDISGLLKQAEAGGSKAAAHKTSTKEKIEDENIDTADIETHRVKVSPAAAKLAKELNVDPSSIKKNGRIMKKDILEASKTSKAVEMQHTSNRGEKTVKMSNMRKVIAERMKKSASISPAVTYNMTMDTSELKRLKNSIKDIFKVTYTDLLIKIVSQVLKEFPLANCSVERDAFILKDYVNMGVAVALDDGLLVPVIKNCDIKGLRQITAEFNELVEKARENKLVPDDLTGGTFTITNLGMFGIDTFSPIINQPEVAILGVNKIVNTPVVVNGQIIVRPLMSMSLTADHRAIDGAYAARVLQRIKQYVEKPGLLVL
ncbi:MAG TPA: PdhC [Clostridium sp.]|jgi:pyruvate dehydrogenase E2 component (dihydrolipoamide acetyltransferase)|uniref:Dihydrolipoamide acetyltransferase component of pyruvate dehydrogenase complex n=1 Tax=Clostridium lapidicellarium TaxID=3240931 RepID=A0ABV4DXS4_9CLOT|nr:dihydrolipoamide acetyltransferase family protein [uncultured Clostridium sp.]HBC96651.1 PdhC [Clostridium sp.]